MAQGKNIVKYNKARNINIGMIIFFVIFVYIAFNIFQYFTKDTISAYEVTHGSIASNNTYRGLILRDETVSYADKNGYVNYYMKNGSRVSVNDVIYSIDTKGDISEKIHSVSAGDNVLSVSSMKEVSQTLDVFSSTYHSSEFSDAIAFKENLSSTLLQIITNAALDQLGDQVNLAASNSTFYLMKPSVTGIVAYYIDGYEGKSLEDFDASYMNFTGYNRENLNLNEKVSYSDPVYKIVTDEAWDVIIEISPDLAEDLAEGSVIKIRFCEDDYVTNARYKIVQEGKQYFLDLRLQTAMIRYINERFVDVELILNEKEGLKIPKSAITSKDFFTVPKSAFMQGKDSSSYGLLLSTMTEEGEVVTFITPTIYYESDDFYYIDDEDLSYGDTVLIGDSSMKYTIGSDVDSLIGVYNINKGYAVFKQINIIYENEEYAIVEQKTSYGICLYDHIALDGSKLTENQLTTK